MICIHTYLRGFLVSVLFLLAPYVQAGLFGSGNLFGAAEGPLDVEQAFVFSAQQADSNSVQLRWQMPERYYLYRDRVDIVLPEGISLHSRVNSPAEAKDDPLFGEVWVYHDAAQMDLILSSDTGSVKSGVVSVTYQGCWEGGICYPPVTKEVEVKDVTPYTGAQPVPVVEPAAGVPQAGFVSEQDQFASLLSGDDLLLTLAAFFVAGLALSFTPCVFPMVPILSSIIAGQGRRITTRRAFWLSLVYVLSVAVTYTLAGIVAGMFGENLQAAFQTPWLISLFAALFVALSLSMFGFYDLQIPNAWQTRLNRLSNGQKGGTVLGVIAMGLLSALIVGPCMAAPLAGALIYIGESGDPVLGGMALLSLSLGMGVPLILVGTSAGKFLPKAGVWMESVKAGFGVMLLLLAIWMLDRIVMTEVTMLLTAIVLIGSAIFMHALDKLPEHAGNWLRLWKGVGVIVLIYGAALLIGALSGNRSMIYPLQGVSAAGISGVQSSKLPFETVTSMTQLSALLDEARAQGRPVMLDFYADWCISCAEIESFTFSDSEVRSVLAPFRLIKVDVTANDAESKVLNKTYGVIGPPALIFYDAKGTLHSNMTLIGVVEPQAFVAHIARLHRT